MMIFTYLKHYKLDKYIYYLVSYQSNKIHKYLLCLAHNLSRRIVSYQSNKIHKLLLLLKSEVSNP